MNIKQLKKEVFELDEIIKYLKDYKQRKNWTLEDIDKLYDFQAEHKIQSLWIVKGELKGIEIILEGVSNWYTIEELEDDLKELEHMLTRR